ncbi:MAG: SDR family NAD(P)-dependent oxidoreductase [Candidatus Taylorbacteria bacterium]|nr:SDR family NAD(P)-dependent oxidoreductase [Candidatus Taylorbacteria bacterium]
MKKISFLKGKTVLITGGTGSFGRNFAKYLLEHAELKKLIIFSRDEFKQSQMRQEISDPRVRFFVGDVRDSARLNRAFNGVDIVVHAAALKQVPTLEYNPFEAVKTNIMGSQNVIDAAVDCKVGKVLLISTDKASQPVNLYGATKLCAEKLFVNGNAYGPEVTRFACVRYGNVMGSRGSIIEKLIKTPSQDTVHITHEEMTRFWINLEQSFQLVLFALENMLGGEIFVGIRPGEKLHEMLLSKEEARHTVELEKYYVVLPEDSEVFNVAQTFKKYFQMGKRLPEGFSFESHTNKQWLTKSGFSKYLEILKKTLALK